MLNARKLNNLLNSLNGSFVSTGSELIDIKKVNRLVSLYSFSHNSNNYSEITLSVDAIIYSENGDTVIETPVNTIFFTVDTSQIITVTNNNIAILLCDKCNLVRKAALQWYNRLKTRTHQPAAS